MEKLSIYVALLHIEVTFETTQHQRGWELVVFYYDITQHLIIWGLHQAWMSQTRWGDRSCDIESHMISHIFWSQAKRPQSDICLLLCFRVEHFAWRQILGKPNLVSESISVHNLQLASPSHGQMYVATSLFTMVVENKSTCKEQGSLVVWFKSKFYIYLVKVNIYMLSIVYCMNRVSF